MESIILASSSPRRQSILKMLNIPFQVIIPDIDENIDKGDNIFKVPEKLAVRKVEGCINMLPRQRSIPWILGADTMVCMDGELYGKPSGAEEAAKYLNALQGRQHFVITSIALYNGRQKKIVTSTNITKVTFSKMDDKEIEWYVKTGEWHGAAGGYRIQELASCFIKEIEGSMSSVAGLPISNLYDILKSQGYSILE
ncbi:Maf family protein [Treponema parvum]|uniref:Maf family protein n=1 Tax=Treponema parvum TaxID=138851 RepID=UPI001AEC28BB|nr:Maf family protein [Treponema parvum]QTQ16173.1 septum formation protein Maf [Treponema parvum]